MEKSNKATGLMVKSPVMETVEAIDAQLKKITEINGSSYKTSGEFKFNPAYTAGSPIYIQKETNVKTLITILGFLMSQESNFEKAAQELGVTNYPLFEWMGYNLESWKNDIKLRINIVTQHDKIEKLKKAKKELEQFMTTEDRMASVLTGIEDLLK